MNPVLEAIFSGTIAIAGLILVFLGLVHSVYASYDALSSTTDLTRHKFRKRIWAIIGLLGWNVALILVCLASLGGLVPCWIAIGGFTILVIAMFAIAVWVTYLIV